MLYLQRRIGEEIVIDGGRVRVRFVARVGNSVTLAVDADRSISVDRAEVFDAQGTSDERRPRKREQSGN